MIAQFLSLYRTKDRLVGTMDECAFRILLDLADGGPRDTTGLANGSGAPQTTALRHLGELVNAGWIERLSDPHDRRRTIYRLTRAGMDLLAIEKELAA